jgi:hypothetical protein
LCAATLVIRGTRKEQIVREEAQLAPDEPHLNPI